MKVKDLIESLQKPEDQEADIMFLADRDVYDIVHIMNGKKFVEKGVLLAEDPTPNISRPWAGWSYIIR